MRCEQYRDLAERELDGKLNWLRKRAFYSHSRGCRSCCDYSMAAWSARDAARERSDDGSFDLASAQTPITGIANSILAQCLNMGAICAQLGQYTPGILMWRCEVAGELRDVVPLPLYIAAPLVAALKAMANLDWHCTDHPQQGTFTVRCDEQFRQVEIALSPTAMGELVELRFLG